MHDLEDDFIEDIIDVDVKDCKGYMIVNVGDPAKQNVSENTIEFSDFNCVMVVKNGVTSYRKLNEGKYTCYLEEGESVFVIPYNN